MSRGSLRARRIARDPRKSEDGEICLFCGVRTDEEMTMDPRTNERYCPSCTSLWERLRRLN